MALVKAAGTASESAQGQLTTSTANAADSACAGSTACQASQVERLARSTPGMNQAATRSAMLFNRDLCANCLVSHQVEHRHARPAPEVGSPASQSRARR